MELLAVATIISSENSIMTLFTIVQTYWAIIGFLGTVVAQWVRQEMKVSALKECVDSLEKDLEKTKDRMTMGEKSNDVFRETIQISVAQIMTNLEYIKDYIKENK